MKIGELCIPEVTKKLNTIQDVIKHPALSLLVTINWAEAVNAPRGWAYTA
jgi:hypothetical protein